MEGWPRKLMRTLPMATSEPTEEKMARAPKRRWVKLQALPSSFVTVDLEAVSMSTGSGTIAVMSATRRAKQPRITYGMRTECASCAAVAPAAMKMKKAPTFGAMVVAEELKMPQRLMRHAP